MKGRKNSGNRLATGGGELIAMSAGDFSDQAVGAQQAQPVTYPGGAPTSFLSSRSRMGEKTSLQIAVAEPVQGELPSAHRLQPRTILGEGTQSPDAVSVPVPTLPQTPDELFQRGVVVHFGQVALRGSARDFGSPVQVGNPTSHPPPSARPLGVTFPGTVDAQVIPVVQGRFGAQHTPDRGKGFVVKLHRVAVQGVLDADPFLTLPQIADHFAVKALRDLSTRRKASAQIAHHVLAAQGGQGVVQQPRVEVPERRGTSEDHIRGPLALVGGPVIVGLEGTEDRFVRRVQLSGALVQPARPLYSQLRIQQSLRVGPVFHPGKAVVLPHKLQARGRHLPGQPLPSVQADLDGEGKPSLNARVHETPAGMNRVVVKKQAFSPTLHQVQLLRLPIAVDLKTPAELHRRQDGNQPLANALLGGDLPRQGFFVRLRGSQVLDGPPPLDRFRQRSLLQPLAHLLDVATEVLPQNLVHRQVGVHAVDVGEGPQGPSKDQSVEPGKYSRNLISVFCDKLLHGVSVPPPMCGLWITNTSYRNRDAFLIWLRLCRAVYYPNQSPELNQFEEAKCE